jgi:AcrR family transcriptional regulator
VRQLSSVVAVVAEKADLRREAGQRTRDRLLAAALELLSERGPEGLTLREITDSAGANVAAVSYHFGSLKALCDTAIEHALERYLDAQHEARLDGARLDRTTWSNVVCPDGVKSGGTDRESCGGHLRSAR